MKRGGVVLIALLLFAVAVRAASVYDNSVTVHTFGGTTLTTAAFTISGTNRAAYIGFQFNGVVTGITASCGGVAASAVTGADVINASNIRVVWFVVIAPPTGSQTCTASWTNSVSASMGVITATGVDQTTPANNGTANDCGTATTCATTVTSTNGDLTLTIGGAGAVDSAQTTDQTLRQADFGCVDTGPGTGTTTHTWSHASTTMLNAGLNAKAVAGATVARRRILN